MHHDDFLASEKSANEIFRTSWYRLLNFPGFSCIVLGTAYRLIDATQISNDAIHSFQV